MTNSISISRVGDKIAVKSPYNASFAGSAKSISGKWDGIEREWIFPGQLEGEVRNMLKTVYGTDGSVPAKLVDIRVSCAEHADDMLLAVFGYKDKHHKHTEILLNGRVLVSVAGRDTGARIEDGVILRAGGFTSGGSMKYPEMELLKPEGAITMEVLGVPEAHAAELVAAHPEFVSVIERATVDPNKLLRDTITAALALSPASDVKAHLEAALGEL